MKRRWICSILCFVALAVILSFYLLLSVNPDYVIDKLLLLDYYVGTVMGHDYCDCCIGDDEWRILIGDYLPPDEEMDVRQDSRRKEGTPCSPSAPKDSDFYCPLTMGDVDCDESQRYPSIWCSLSMASGDGFPRGDETTEDVERDRKPSVS